MKTILIVDDDIHIGNMLEEVLQREGYLVARAFSGTEALLVLSGTAPDLILLDLMLPGLSGEDLLPRVREIPTIIVSAKLDLDNKVKLLLEGAVDYVTKPFHTRELLARIQVALRSASNSGAPLLTHRELSLNTDTYEVTVEQTPVRLTRTEFAILKVMMEQPDKVFSKSNLLDSISRETPDCTESSLKIHISNLRKKLRACNDRDYIEAVWGIGFKLA